MRASAEVWLAGRPTQQKPPHHPPPRHHNDNDDNRKCKEAKYFLPTEQGMLCPYAAGEDPNVPPCPRCPMLLSSGGAEGKPGVLTCQVRKE